MGGFRGSDPDTCRRAYEQIKEDGTLSKRRLEVIECLSREAEPATAGELAKSMKTNRNNLATRLSELEHLGVVYKVLERECGASSRICWTWLMTGNKPSGEVPKNISTNEILRGQRDRAVKQSEELTLLLRNVSLWLKCSYSDISVGTANRAAVKIDKNTSKILGIK